MDTDDVFEVSTPEDQLAVNLADFPSDVVAELVKLRTDRNIDQQTLARRMNRHPSQVSRFENEESDPRLSTIIRYAYAIGAELAFQATPVPVHGYESHRGGDLIIFPTRVTVDAAQGSFQEVSDAIEA